ncbi:hypothetical protein GCM10010254_72750 [Streptomyces chromofuscus]|nr:hypothetical protein GCM10010254_72750 [Streptomyces chromofuscus]
MKLAAVAVTEPVSWYTYTGMAIMNIQSPISETNPAVHSRRKPGFARGPFVGNLTGNLTFSLFSQPLAWLALPERPMVPEPGPAANCSAQPAVLDS